MNIVIINETGVETFKSWSQVKKYSSFDKEDFTAVGKDFVLNCNNETYEVSKDIKLLERVASQRVFTKNSVDMGVVASWIAAALALMVYMKL